MLRGGASRVRAALSVLALSAAILAAVPGTTAAQTAPDLPFRPGYVMVGYRDGVGPAARADVRSAVGTLGRVLLPKADLVRLGAGVDVADAIARLERDPRVAYAEPDYIVRPSVTYTSNDPYYTNNSLWGMYGDTTPRVNAYGSQAGEAWTAGYVGSSSVVIGVIDEGIDVSHPDLVDNIWVNPGESGTDASGGNRATNGVDDDGNGYVDDVNGWDFYNGDNSVFDAADGDDHGTHVSGTIGAKGGNGVGVAGVNWNVKIISAKFLGPGGGYTSDAVSALNYLRVLKTRAVNPVNIVASSNSWGGGGSSTTLRNAIIAAGNAGMLFVAAAGNSSLNADNIPQYPAAYTCPTNAGFDCVISVASITSSGSLSSFSNYGATSVDLGAPGSGIYSTTPLNTYSSYSGTSMATPHVSGAVALCASMGTTSPSELRRIILATAAPTTSLSGKTVTGGRLDVGAMINSCRAGVLSLTTMHSVKLTISKPRGTSPSVAISTTGGTAWTTTCSSSSCSNNLIYGTTVTFQANFVGTGTTRVTWSGCDSTTASTCTVSVNGTESVTAKFAK